MHALQKHIHTNDFIIIKSFIHTYVHAYIQHTWKSPKNRYLSSRWLYYLEAKISGQPVQINYLFHQLLIKKYVISDK